MKIGALVFLTDQSGNPGAIAREAENLGFESFFVAEHMVVPSTYTTHYPRSRDGKVPEFYARLIDPFVALAIAADATSRIKIGTAICLLPQRDVIETAKVTASIDLYSKGRLILGVGAGWFREEAEVMGVNFARRWQHLRESVEAFKESVPGTTAQDVMRLVLMTQYFDTLKEIAANDHSNTILIPHTPNTLTDIYSQIRNAIIAGNELSSHAVIPPVPSAPQK